MMIANKLSFKHPDEFYLLPSDFVGKWREYDHAKNSGKMLKQSMEESKSKRR